MPFFKKTNFALLRTEGSYLPDLKITTPKDHPNDMISEPTKTKRR